MVRQCYVLFEIEVHKKYIFSVWTKRFSFVVMMNIHEEDGVGSCSNVITGKVCSISIHSDDSERHEKVDFFTREWNDWLYQNVEKMHTWCMILVVLTRCLSSRQNLVKIWQLVWFEWAKKCYGILKVKEFCDERLLVSGVNAQNNKYHRKMRLCFIRDDGSTWEIPVHAN